MSDYGIKSKPITVRNPQANVIVKHFHHVIGNIVWIFGLETYYQDKEDPWKGGHVATAFAVWSTNHATLKSTPGQLVFGCDMIFIIQHVANWSLSDRINNTTMRKITKQKMLNARHTSTRRVTRYCSKEEQKITMNSFLRDHFAYNRLMITVQSALR